MVLTDEDGSLRADLDTGCDRCMWNVLSTSAWAVSQLQMFRDSSCADAISGHVIASSAGCDGISVAGTGSAEQWCGGANSWIGLWTDETEYVKCVRVRGNATEGLTLRYTLSGVWYNENTWLSQIGGSGVVEVELQVECSSCAWMVNSSSAWSVAELRMFGDISCGADQKSGHAIARRTGCDGIPIIADGNFGLGAPAWCGDGDWAGLVFEDEETTVNCALVSGTVTLGLSLASIASLTWASVDSWTVLSESGGVVTAEVRTACDSGECAWYVKSSEAWSVSSLQFFTDSACSQEIVGHAIASVSGCDGISAVQVLAGEWCGDAGDWVGLWHGGVDTGVCSVVGRRTQRSSRRSEAVAVAF